MDPVCLSVNKVSLKTGSFLYGMKEFALKRQILSVRLENTLHDEGDLNIYSRISSLESVYIPLNLHCMCTSDGISAHSVT